MSGAVAKSGEDTLNAIKLAVEIINGQHPELNIPFAKTTGLPRLKNAKIELITADHQANPEIGAAEAERMISQRKVVALIGTFLSSVASTVSTVAERNEIPFMTGDSEATPLTERGYKWLFRTTPTSRDQAVQRRAVARALARIDRGPLIVAGDMNLTPWAAAMREQDARR